MGDATHTTKDFTPVADKGSRDKIHSSLVRLCASRRSSQDLCRNRGFILAHVQSQAQGTGICLFKGVLIAPGDYTWKHVLMYVPATESKKSVAVCLCSSVCVFLSPLVCALGLCVSMHMDVFPFCSCLLFLAERSQMRKADKFKEVEKIS